MKRKLSYLLVIFISMFIYSSEVGAEDAKCVYKMGSGHLECSLTDGQTPSCTLNTKYSAYEKLGTINLSNVNFQDVGNNQWLCPKNIYSEATTSARVTTFSNISIDSDGASNRVSNALDESLSSYGNKISDEKENISYCKYGDLILTVNHTKKEISGSAANCGSTSIEFDYSKLNSNDCPSQIYQLKASDRTKVVCKYSLSSKTSYRKIELNADEPIEDATGNEIEIDQNPEEKDEQIVTDGETIKILKRIYNMIKILIPVLIILLSIVDFLKILVVDDEKNYKSAWDRLIKRLMVGVIFFILPILISFLIKYSGIKTEQTFLDIFK